MQLAVFVALALFVAVSGNGRLWDPVNRNSAWRKGFPGPVDYDDFGDVCGYSPYDADKIPEGCGPCGNKNFPRSGMVVQTYKGSQQIEITVELSSNKKGYFTFRLCPSNGDGNNATEACFNQHKLPVLNSPNPTKPDRYELGQGKNIYHKIYKFLFI